MGWIHAGQWSGTGPRTLDQQARDDAQHRADAALRASHYARKARQEGNSSLMARVARARASHDTREKAAKTARASSREEARLATEARVLMAGEIAGITPEEARAMYYGGPMENAIRARMKSPGVCGWGCVWDDAWETAGDHAWFFKNYTEDVE